MSKKKEETKDLAVKQDQAIAVPDYLLPKEGEGSRGRENVDKSDLVLPRLKLLQPLSPEAQDEDKNAEAGHLFNTLTQQDFGSSIIFIPIVHFKSRIYWRDRDDDSGERIICSASDGLHPKSQEFADLCTSCKKQVWNNQAKDPKDKAPKCTMLYNFAILIEGEASPIALSMERSKIKVAKKLLSLITCTGNLDMFAKKYKLGVTKEKNKKGIWYNYDITPVGFVTADEFKVAESTYQSLKDLAVTVDQNTETE